MSERISDERLRLTADSINPMIGLSVYEDVCMARELLAARRVVEAAHEVVEAAKCLCHMMDAHPERHWQRTGDCAQCEAIYEAECKLFAAIRAYDAAQPPAGETESKAGGADGSATRKDAGELAAAGGLRGSPSPPAPSPPAAPAVGAEEMIERLRALAGWTTEANTNRIAMQAIAAHKAEVQAAEARGKEQERQRWLAHVATRDAAVAAAEAECARLHAEVERLTGEIIEKQEWLGNIAQASDAPVGSHFRNLSAHVYSRCALKPAQPARGEARTITDADARAIAVAIMGAPIPAHMTAVQFGSPVEPTS